VQSYEFYFSNAENKLLLNNYRQFKKIVIPLQAVLSKK